MVNDPKNIVGDVGDIGAAQLRVLKTHGDINLMGFPLFVVAGRLVGVKATKASLLITRTHVGIFAGFGLTGFSPSEKPNSLDRVWPVDQIQAARVGHSQVKIFGHDIPAVLGRFVLVDDKVGNIHILNNSGDSYTFVPKEAHFALHAASVLFDVLEE